MCEASLRLLWPAETWHAPHFPIAAPLSSAEVRATGSTEEDAACARSTSHPFGSRHTEAAQTSLYLRSRTRLPLAPRASMLYSLRRFEVVWLRGVELNPVAPRVLGFSFVIISVVSVRCFCCTARWLLSKKKKKQKITSSASWIHISSVLLFNAQASLLWRKCQNMPSVSLCLAVRGLIWN